MKDTFYEKCFISKFPHVCFEGFSVLLFGFLFSILNLYAFIRMTKYYGKMNFENTVLLFSAIQSIFLIIEMIISENILISVFIFIQISSMCLINYKFKKISKGFVNLKYNYLTIIIAVVNTVYLFVFFAIYIIERLNFIDKISFYIITFYYILELLSSFLLSYNCCVFLGLMKNYQIKDKKKESTNLVGNGLFYLIKKRQITLLYMGNILCSFFDFGFNFAMTFIIDKNRKENDFYYVYYSFFLLCFIHNSINYISFYWMIREQYSKEQDIEISEEYEEDENADDNILDQKFIEGEIFEIKKENTKIAGYIDDVRSNNSFQRTASVYSFKSDMKTKNLGNNNNNNNNDESFQKSTNDDNFEEIGKFLIINNEKVHSN